MRNGEGPASPLQHRRTQVVRPPEPRQDGGKGEVYDVRIKAALGGLLRGVEEASTLSRKAALKSGRARRAS